MTLRRFRVPQTPMPGAWVAFAPAVAHHLRVLRLEEGAQVQLFDGTGAEAEAVLEGGGARVLSRSVQVEAHALSVLIGMPKAATFDQVLRDLTEVGATAILPFYGARSAARADTSRQEHKRDRWERIVREAARQSERLQEPRLALPGTLASCLDDVPSDAVLFALDAREGEDFRRECVAGQRHVAIVIGPEGGLDPAELALLRKHHARSLRLALPVLRAETAAVVVAALMRQMMHESTATPAEAPRS